MAISWKSPSPRASGRWGAVTADASHLGRAQEVTLCPSLPNRRWLVPTLGGSPVPEVLTMVMILSKSLDNQGADSIACRTFNPELVRTQWASYLR